MVHCAFYCWPVHFVFSENIVLYFHFTFFIRVEYSGKSDLFKPEKNIEVSVKSFIKPVLLQEFCFLLTGIS